jgi:hypothetical protein
MEAANPDRRSPTKATGDASYLDEAIRGADEIAPCFIHTWRRPGGMRPSSSPTIPSRVWKNDRNTIRRER